MPTIHPMPIDLNVWNAMLYGDHPTKNCVVITAYSLRYSDATGYWSTNTDDVLFHIDTDDLDVNEWDDEWYEVIDEATLADLPPEILAHVKPLIQSTERGK